MATSPEVTGVLTALAVLVAATVFGMWWRSRQGLLRTEPASAKAPDSLRSLGVSAGSVTLLQFSSRQCAACHATRRLLADLAAADPQLAHVEVDVEQHLDAVRDLGIGRTPTVLVVRRDGTVAVRTSGLPARADMEAAIRPLLAAAGNAAEAAAHAGVTVARHPQELP